MSHWTGLEVIRHLWSGRSSGLYVSSAFASNRTTASEGVGERPSELELAVTLS